MKTEVKNRIIISILIAMFIPLSYFSFFIPTINVKVTLQNLPIYVSGILYGPIVGMIVGLIGQLISQILQYGMSVTIVLWVLPQTILGFLTGILLYNNKIDIEVYDRKFILSIIILNLIITICNTICIYIDALIIGQNIYAITISLISRIVGSIITAIIYIIVLPHIIKAIKKLG